MVIQTEAIAMYGTQLIEMAQVAEQEHMQAAIMARARAQARIERRRMLGPGRFARAWAAFWASGDMVAVQRRTADSGPADLTPCVDC
jgi:CHASE1-domain containing sensor protein